MKVVFDAEAWAECPGWQHEDPDVVAKLNRVSEECRCDPFGGTGKPYALKQNLTGWWSRRITREHRLVNRVRRSGEAQAVEVLSGRYHY